MDATVETRPEAAPRERPPVSDFALWTSVLTGPVVFLVNMEVNYVMTDWACESGTTWALHLAHLIALAIVVAGGLLGLSLWRRVGQQWPDPGGGSVSRSRMLAAVGALGCALFAVCIVAEWITVVVLGSCLRA
jgi:hypothetical protein